MAMAEFPPNPEDGELWLPSDVFHEIASDSSSHQAVTDNAAHNHVEQAAIKPKNFATRSFPDLLPNNEVRGVFSGTKPDGNGLPAFDHYACRDGGYPLFPGHIRPYCSLKPTQNQGSEKIGASVFPGQQNCPWRLLLSREEVNGFAGKCGGTGVFLPRSTDRSKEADGTTGTGVFLKPQDSLTHGRKRKSGKKGKGNRQKSVNTKEAMENKPESQISEEISLPNDWVY